MYAGKDMARDGQNFDISHYRTLTRIARFACDSKHQGLVIRGWSFKQGLITLELYVDADFAADMPTRKSTSGFVLYLNNDVLAFNSKLQTTVASSTASAEVNALALGATELMHYYRVISQITAVQLPMIVHIDNVAARLIAERGFQQLTRQTH